MLVKMLALVDCNNFYVSCERVFNPGLQGRPVIVLSNNDGCVISRSNEVKALGIKMGEPAFRIGDLLERNHVTVFSSNYCLYGDLSHRVMQTLAAFTPELEIYSIDEAFMDLTGITVDWEGYARRICAAVRQNTGIPVSVGIGPTKVLAKTANHYAKKVPANHGVLVLDDPARIAAALQEFAIAEVWGIGRQYAAMLNRAGVRTAADFVNLPDAWVRRKMTVVGLRIKKELEGLPCLELELVPPAKKAMCTSRSFGATQTDLGPLREAVATFANQCAVKLRRQKTCAGQLQVFIHTNGFKPAEPQYARNFISKLPTPTNSSLMLIKYALGALEAIYRPGYRYKKAGVLVYDLTLEEQAQGALFDPVDYEKHAAVMRTLDRLNARYGANTVKSAAQGSGVRWKLRQEKLSPCYTTRWKDIISVKL
ncbi:MAG: Y-family DNA polymerase [Bacillota bacterium]|jgi:DNA polymerase V